jgi:hypothetical protein
LFNGAKVDALLKSKDNKTNTVYHICHIPPDFFGDYKIRNKNVIYVLTFSHPFRHSRQVKSNNAFRIMIAVNLTAMPKEGEKGEKPKASIHYIYVSTLRLFILAPSLGGGWGEVGLLHEVWQEKKLGL